MSDRVNHQIKLVARPEGLPKRSDFSYEACPVAEPGENEVLIKVCYISLDPAMRGWMRDVKSYIEPVPLGGVMRAGGVGKVIASNNPKFALGTYVTGMTGAQEYVISNGVGLVAVDPSKANLTTFLGTLGMPGMTAYFGLLDVCKLKEGDTVVVSGAAGAVGSVVGQIARIKGCTVVGIAGSAEKCAYVTDELGFNACFNYKEDDLFNSLRQFCPKGIDVYFDNVGGETLDIVLAQIRRGARIGICGAISQYNNTDGVVGPKNYLSLLVNRGTMTGFVVFDYASRYGEAVRDIATWLAQGKMIAREHVVDGLETFPETLNMLFSGGNFGKLAIKVSDPD